MKKIYELSDEEYERCALICKKFMSECRDVRREELLLAAENDLVEVLDEGQKELFRILKEIWCMQARGDCMELAAFILYSKK